VELVDQEGMYRYTLDVTERVIRHSNHSLELSDSCGKHLHNMYNSAGTTFAEAIRDFCMFFNWGAREISVL
jgi:hypothetical protein